MLGGHLSLKLGRNPALWVSLNAFLLSPSGLALLELYCTGVEANLGGEEAVLSFLLCPITLGALLFSCVAPHLSCSVEIA